MSFRENTVKIVSTIGPASSSKQMIKSLIDAGVDIFRLNFSHGTHKEKSELVERIRGIDDKVGIMADIQGPKIRVGKFKNDEAYILNVGQDVKVFESEIPGGGDQTQFSIPLVGFLKSMKKGNVFFVNDGIIKIEVKSKEKDHLIGEVIAGGLISNNKGVNIPTGELNQSVPTEKDIKDLEFIADINPEFVAISFVSNGDDVLTVKKLLENYGNDEIK
ncbi:MAG: pyruvate kinase, partial [Candidatus Lokiarchaeia archaeon]